MRESELLSEGGVVPAAYPLIRRIPDLAWLSWRIGVGLMFVAAACAQNMIDDLSELRLGDVHTRSFSRLLLVFFNSIPQR